MTKLITEGLTWGRMNIVAKILLIGGLTLIALEFINAEILGRTFHGEFLLAGTTLIGAAITQWKEQK